MITLKTQRQLDKFIDRFIKKPNMSVKNKKQLSKFIRTYLNTFGGNKDK